MKGIVTTFIKKFSLKTFISECYRYDFVSCNRPDYFVIEIHVKPGHPSEIYADRENKVGLSVSIAHILSV